MKIQFNEPLPLFLSLISSNWLNLEKKYELNDI